MVWGHLDEMKQFFSRYNFPLKTIPPSPGVLDYVDFASGKTAVDHTPSGLEAVGAAMHGNGTELAKYPEIQAGSELKYSVAENLLLPFVDRYDLGAMIPTVFAICQGYSPLLEISTVYVFKYLNTDPLDSLNKGFVTTERSNFAVLYDRAREELGSDALLNTYIVAMARSSHLDRAIVLVQTETGRKLILAKRTVSTIPLYLENMRGFDRSNEEESFFARFQSSAFYSCAIRAPGLRIRAPIYALSSDTLYNIPRLPGSYALVPNPATNLVHVYYGNRRLLGERRVRDDILAVVPRIEEDRGMDADSPSEIVSFPNHAPFNMVVGKYDIEDAFHMRL
ncbi:MAG: hypothetical protein M1831_002871 [Alyxoria varia]|nr:MAG: hypothetical protein M1831_002871 [Alyxoria varia]